MLYLIKSGKYTKVGYTSNIEKRLSKYNTENPNYEVLGVKDGEFIDESEYHKRLNDYHIKGEWFLLPDNVLEEITAEFCQYQCKTDTKKPKEYVPRDPSWEMPNVKYKVYCRKSKCTKSGLSPVEIAFYINNKRTMRPLGFAWDPYTFKEDKDKEPLKTKLEQEIQKHINYA